MEPDGVNPWVLLIALLASHIILLISLLKWLYPPNEVPNNMKMIKMTKCFQNVIRSGAPVFPGTAFSLQELREICDLAPYKGRGIELTDTDCKIMRAAKDGDIHYLKDHKDLQRNIALNYGALITKRTMSDLYTSKESAVNVTCSAENKTVTSAMMKVSSEEFEDVLRAPLKRQKPQKAKKNKEKKRLDALKQLTCEEADDLRMTKPATSVPANAVSPIFKDHRVAAAEPPEKDTITTTTTTIDGSRRAKRKNELLSVEVQPKSAEMVGVVRRAEKRQRANTTTTETVD